MSNHIFPVVTESEKQLPLYLTGVGCYYHQEHVARPEGYPNFQWIQCFSGEGELLLGGKSYTVGARQGMLLYPNEAHEYYESRGPWEVDWIGFDGCLVKHWVRNLGFERSSVFYITKGETVLAKMRLALKVSQSNDYFKGLECSAIVYQLLLDLYKYGSHLGDDSILKQYSRLQPVLDYMEQYYSEEITLEDLAKTIRVTPQYLCWLFKNILKIRPFEHLNQVRVNKSKDIMFSQRGLTIKNIAAAVGYDNVSYFCTVFKEIEGITPGQFRKLHGI